MENTEEDAGEVLITAAAVVAAAQVVCLHPAREEDLNIKDRNKHRMTGINATSEG